ncbi:MAG TPA: BrnA antitoxin family protein [Pyrinomonadaceae bacterium]|nr:BrnA antitoxin family protein [Pyrinomonadaceae bacterium]
MKDEDIDTSDIPPLDDTFFANAKLRLPGNKVPVTVNVDADALEWFKAQGEESQNRINAALRIYAEAHKEQPR